MSRQLLYFNGVAVAKDSMTGVISSEQLIAQFGSNWIPAYQRGRVLSASKIRALTEIFKNYGPRKIDSIKLNIDGDCTIEKKTGEAILEGTISVIDGQQRLYALKESKVTGILLPVELYINLPVEEQIKLFHQFNKEGTQLSFGELAKSAIGPFSEPLRALLRRKTTAIPLSINGNRHNMGLALFCPITHQCHRRLFRDVQLVAQSSGKSLLKFLEAPTPDHEVNLALYAAKNILAASVDIFGTYDNKATVYHRSFYLAFASVIINNFMESSGKVNFGKFKTKVKEIPEVLAMNAQIKEIVRGGGSGVVELLYNEIIDHLNFKLKSGHLLRTNEIRQSAQAIEQAVGATRARYTENAVARARAQA